MTSDELKVLHRTWMGMRHRCRNSRAKSYRLYGGRGIAIDPRWDTFLTFALDMGPRPSGHSIDRVDNDGPYSPDNCRWATQKQQCNNKANNRLVTAFGETKNVQRWLEDRRCVATRSTLTEKLRRGVGPEDAMTVRKGKRGRPATDPLVHAVYTDAVLTALDEVGDDARKIATRTGISIGKVYEILRNARAVRAGGSAQ